ncbi:MAG: Asp-tRNA(Asn)/Glu-tRNA(Gln) amidotransferase subunit GatA [bacterium]|jgi:aspartyl-tRNA(Asn)/glutamyl-tRNA(Gln) amidotransferase subunit A|nr:Asp-tRNA(Asn)/Glu-tRNA(Gln) amidotransferase subunit GatA [bacterium]
MDIANKTVVELLKLMGDGSLTSENIVQHYLNQIDAKNEELNALVRVSETALDEAREIDKRRAAGEEVGRLAGIPIVLKDNMLHKGWEVTGGSQILEGHIAAYDSTVVERLRAADAIILGLANMDEHAMGSTNESSHHGATYNPWDTTKVPGGSSGGSAVAVASGMSPVSLGSDTGGSIRLPSALCGVTGFKPTYGRVSRYGLMPYASSFDQIGPIAQDLRDAALVLEVIEGKDARDATSVELPNTTIPALLDTDVSGLKIGLPKEYFLEGMDSEIRRTIMEAVEELKSLGAEVVEISLPSVEYALAAYYILVLSEASSNLGRYDGLRYGYHSGGENLAKTYERSRGEGFGPEAKRRILLGTYTLSAGYYDAYYRKAQKVRTLIKQDIDKAFHEVDAILTPTSPSVAWGMGEKFKDPLTMYLADIFTITANMATVPAMSIPCGFVDGLPVGMQLMGKPFDEHTLFKIGAAYQDKTDWHTKRPV